MIQADLMEELEEERELAEERWDRDYDLAMEMFPEEVEEE